METVRRDSAPGDVRTGRLLMMVEDGWDETLVAVDTETGALDWRVTL
jgi:hypothetical protein